MKIRSARTPALAKKMGRQNDEFKLEVMETLLRRSPCMIAQTVHLRGGLLDLTDPSPTSPTHRFYYVG